MALVISGLSVLFGLLALPTANFADIVKSEGKRYCEISIPGDTPQEAQINISVYYLFYSSILSYWLPLMVGSILKSDFPREMIDTLTHCFRFPSHL